MTKTEKVLQFDTVKADLDKLELALFDIVNHKFKSIGVRIWYKDYAPKETGMIEMKISPERGDPLFLVVDHSSSTLQPRLFTETEIMQMHRENVNVGAIYPRMLYNGACQLISKYLAKAA